jgi:hypothetical protein
MKTTSRKFLAGLALMTFLVYGYNKMTDYDHPIHLQNGSALEFTPQVNGVLPTPPELLGISVKKP